VRTQTRIPAVAGWVDNVLGSGVYLLTYWSHSGLLVVRTWSRWAGYPVVSSSSRSLSWTFPDPRRPC